MTLAQGRAPKEPAEGKASRLEDAVGPQTEAVVDLDAIAHNVRVLREFAGDAAL
ncbi:MAG: alanine racemase, partial [Rhodococcus sp. (in: high G+C Gram-positive bacteria)]